MIDAPIATNGRSTQPGEWEIGCFRRRGSHWDAGMRSTLMVTA